MPDKSISLFNLEALSVPVAKLIETVSSGIGVLYEPRRIRERAKAEVDAAKIKMKGAIEIQMLATRASYRANAQEARRQRNLEAIIKKASQQLPSEVSNEKVEEDWTAQFLNYAQDIGNEEMQTIWARLLAGEVTHPGSFSLRALNVVRLLQPKDAKTFRRFTDFLWIIDNEFIQVQIPLTTDQLLERNGLSYSAVLHLLTLGLISMHSNLLIKSETGTMTANYHGDEFILSGDRVKRGFEVRILTDVGKELVRLCDRIPVIEYRDAILDFWQRNEIEIKKREVEK
ncbi:MAG: DUF2806 domain-containing protein [Chloroflexi bacterium]|nr:DUF2806 domain-containing protein [Chloroflexota bacterium]